MKSGHFKYIMIFIYSGTLCQCRKPIEKRVAGYAIIHEAQHQGLITGCLTSDGYFLGSMTNVDFSDWLKDRFSLMIVDKDYHIHAHLMNNNNGNHRFVGLGATNDAFLTVRNFEPGQSATYLKKMNKSGDIIDSLKLPGTNNNLARIERLRDGNYMLLTTVISTNTAYTVLHKFSEDLQVIWTRTIYGSTFGMNRYYGYDFTETDNGGIVVVGIDRPVSVLYYEFTQGPIALIKLNSDGTGSAFRIFNEPFYRVADDIEYHEGFIYLLSSKLIPDGEFTTKMTIHKMNSSLDTIYNKEINLWEKQKLDGSFLQKREDGWFIGALELQGYNSNQIVQKSYLINLDENFNITGYRRFGSDRVFGHTFIFKKPDSGYLLAYTDYLPGASYYGYDLVLETLDEGGNTF